MFDYTPIVDQLRMVSWSNFNHPTGVVKWFTGLTFPHAATAVQSNWHSFNNLYIILLIETEHQQPSQVQGHHYQYTNI